MCKSYRVHTRVITPSPRMLSFMMAIKRCTRVVGRGRIAGKLQEWVRGTLAEGSSSTLIQLNSPVSNMEWMMTHTINHFSSVH